MAITACNKWYCPGEHPHWLVACGVRVTAAKSVSPVRDQYVDTNEPKMTADIILLGMTASIVLFLY